MFRPKLLTLVLSSLLAASACSNDQPATATAAPANDASSSPAPSGALAKAAEDVRKDAGRAAMPPVDANRPLEQYPELDDAEGLMFLYLATSRIPPDYERVAADISADFRNTTDSFRKRDLLQALQPQIDQAMSDANAKPYRHMLIDGPDLGAYDFNRAGFPMGEFDEGRYRYFSGNSAYKLTWDNYAAFAFMPVKDEATARAIESMRTDWRKPLRLKVYFMARSADLNDKTLKAHVTRVQVVDKAGQVLAEQTTG